MMATADWAIAHGDALFVLSHLPSGIAQTCVTSPPYFGLRSYGTDPLVWPAVSYAPMPGLPELDVPEWRGDLGLEPTPESFVAHLVAIFREVKRVLRDDGVCWLNMGDSYANDGKWGGQSGGKNYTSDLGGIPRQRVNTGLKPKDLMMIPARLALALQADGWWVRSDVIWQKPNPMPESVTDRPTKSHEHIFLLAKAERYFYDAEAIAEPLAEASKGRMKRKQRLIDRTGTGTLGKQAQGGVDQTHGYAGLALARNGKTGYNPQGRNKRDVWTISTRPFAGAHFAVFPPELPDICIRAGTSERGQCPHCGAPWRRVVEKSTEFHGGSGRAGRTAEDVNANGKWAGKQYGTNIKLGPVNSTQTVGWRPTCECPAHEPVPQLVIDPFSGAGTTGLVATRLGRRYIGIEPNAEYVRMSEHRLVSDAPLFNAAALVKALVAQPGREAS